MTSCLLFFCCTVKWQVKHTLSDLDAPQPHLLRYLFCRDFARHFTESLEVVRGFPGLCLLLVTFGTSIRTDDLGRIGRNCAVRGKAEEHEPTAETKQGKPGRGAEPEPGRPKAMHFENDIHVLLLVQPSHGLAPVPYAVG